MFCWIFLCVFISETILPASSDNGLLNTVTLENNNTPAYNPTNANVIRKWLERENFVENPSRPSNFNYVSLSNGKGDDETTDVVRKEGNAEQTGALKKILGRWVSLMKNKSKNQIPVLKANEQYYSQSPNVLPRLAAMKVLREGGFVDEPSDQEQLPKKGDNDLSPAHWVPRPWWMQSQLEFMSNEIENVKFTTEPIESILLKKENENIALNKVMLNEEKREKKESKWQIGSPINEERKQLKPIEPILEPWVQQYVIDNTKVPNAERNNDDQLYTATENKLLRETDSINPSTERTINAHEAKKVNREPTTANPSFQKIHHAIKVNKESTTANPESIFQNWGLLLYDSQKNKLFEEEHDQLENDNQKDKKQPEAQTLLESVEVDDDRNKALRQKVETWYDNLRSRRKFAHLGVSPELRNVVRFRRNLQSALAALSQKRQLSEWQRSHAMDYRKQSIWRRQLLNQHSMPQAVDYRRLLSLWRKELRRQLQIKWNRRPLVEISPGAFKTDIYVNPPDDLAKHMQKLLALKKRQEDRNRDLNAGNPDVK